MLEALQNRLKKGKCLCGSPTTRPLCYTWRPELKVFKQTRAVEVDLCMELITVPNLLEPDKTLLCEFLNGVFALDETDKGETDLIQLEIDIGEASPIKQSFKRMLQVV